MRQFIAVAEGIDALEPPDKVTVVGQLRGGKGDELGYLCGALVVGRGRLDVVALDEVGCKGCLGVFLEEVEDGISGLLGCHLGGLAAEGGESLVLLGAGNLSLQEMGGIAFDLDDGVVVNYAKFGDVLAKLK